MIPTQIYTFTIGANGSHRLQVAGRFFKILSASGQVRVDADFGTLQPLSGGQGLEDTPFAYLYIADLSGSANTVSVVIGDEKFIDTSLGSISVSSNRIAQGIFSSAQANVTNASAQLLAANAGRQYLLVQNNDLSGSVYINLAGAAATLANSVKLAPGGSLELANIVPTAAIFAIGSIAANANVVVVEGTS